MHVLSTRLRLCQEKNVIFQLNIEITTGFLNFDLKMRSDNPLKFLSSKIKQIKSFSTTETVLAYFGKFAKRLSNTYY